MARALVALVILALILVALVALARARRMPRPTAIDPFAVGEPWRHFVRDAQRARQQLVATVGTTPPGPLRDRLQGIADRLDGGLDEVWQIARRGHELDRAIRRLDPTRLRSRKATLEAEAAASPTANLDAALASVDTQLDSARRLQELSASTADRLRLTQARLDELTTRAAEVSIGATSTDDYATDVDELVLELEGLRQAVQDVQELP